jgi:hypothetical protein
MMTMGERLTKTVQALMVVAALAFAGCGYKDDPVPPQHVLPKAVLDLRAELDDRGATLSWSYPRETVTGGDVEEIDGFELYRAEIPVDNHCPSCPVPYSAAIEVPGGLTVPGSSKTAIYEVRDLRPGNLYFFKVRSKSGWWRESKDSNEVSFLWQTPPATPQGLTALGGDGQNLLQWQPVTVLKDGAKATQPVRYQLYRGVDDGPVDQIGDLLTATTYSDNDVINGRIYAYQIRAVTVYSHGSVNSGLSETVTVQPTDHSPPPIPSRVDALRTEGGVKIYWESVEADDLAGFRVYRRGPGMGQPVMVGEVNLPYTLFEDTTAPAGTLFYSVSSIDTRNPANESARSSEIQAE